MARHKCKLPHDAVAFLFAGLIYSRLSAVLRIRAELERMPSEKVSNATEVYPVLLLGPC